MTGLTGEIYKVRKGDLYNLKRKRSKTIVKNTDGKLSFLNEIICRKRIERFKNDYPSLRARIVETIYADYRNNIILSKWIDGVHPESIKLDWMEQVIETILDMQKIGIFEWDLSRGNILIDCGTVKLFDFGYCYRFNPLNEFNSDGNKSPQSHAIERLETRYIMLELYQLYANGGSREALELYKAIKHMGIRLYSNHMKWLINMEASSTVVDIYRSIVYKWKTALKSDEALKKLFAEESLRSLFLDVEDDLSGKSCTDKTLIRINYLIEIAKTRFDEIRESDLVISFNDKDSFLKYLTIMQAKAVEHQIRNY